MPKSSIRLERLVMKVKKIKEAVARIKDSTKRCSIHDMTFSPLPKKYKKAMEAHIKDRFRLWSAAWILPVIFEIEQELSKKTKVLNEISSF